MGRGKIIKYTENKKFKTKYGTIDNKDVKSVFINFTSWIYTKDNYVEDHQKLINKLNKKLKTKIFNELNRNMFWDNLIIVDLDIRESGLKNSDQTFMSLDINLYQKEIKDFKDDVLVNEMIRLIEIINKKLLEFDKFDYNKVKRKYEKAP